MATPVINPLPPVAPPPYRRSLAGPVVLITLGIVFLLGNIGILDWRNIGWYFSRWWPLLLILWGVIKLFEGWQAQRQGYRARGIGAGGVILIVFVILLGSIASGIAKWGPQIQGDVDGTDFPLLFGQRYTYSDNNSASLPAGGSLRINNDRGDIKVTVSNDDKIHLIANTIVVSHDEPEAQRIREARVPHFSSEGSIVVLSSSGSGVDNSDRARVNMEVQVPRKAVLELNTQHGDVRVIGRDGDVKLTTSHGNGQAEDVNGKVEMHVQHGDVNASKITGDFTIEGRVDDATIADVGGQVELRGDYFGSMNISRVAKPVRFQSSRTDLEIAKVDGEMTMESGDLRVTQLSGPVTLRTKSKDVHFDNFAGDLNLDDTNAEIDVRITKLPVGSIDITNRNGQISLTLPDKASASIDAETRNGEVRSEFPEVKIDSSRDTNHGAGKLGAGTASIRLRTEHGDIEIRKMNTP
jgi:DUF4097 and DUF4098 domain-containing protein YvlB